MDEKKVRIGVDPGDYESTLRRLKSSSDELFRGMVQSARAYSTSAREVLSDIESQIKAIERRNRVDAEGRRAQLQEQFKGGEISETQFRGGIRQIVTESREDKLQTQLLRELIDTVKQQAKDEIREDRANVERRIQESKTVNVRSPRGDEKDILKETVQQYELGRIGQEEISQRGMFDRAQRGLPYLSGVAGSSSIYEAGARVSQTGFGKLGQYGGALGFLGGLGVIGAMAAGRSIQASLPYEQALGRYASLSGQDLSANEGFGREYSSYGYTMDEALNRRYSIARARGTTKGSGQATLDALLMERGFSLDPGLIDQLERLQRGETSGISTRGLVQGTIGTMRGVGMLQGDDMTQLGEILSITNEIGQEQLKMLGKVDSGINTKLVAGIASLSDKFTNSDYLRTAVTSIRSGLTSAPNSQTEALQYAVLSRMKPEASLGELAIMREKGMYAPQMLDMLKTISTGNIDSLQFGLVEFFPGMSQEMAYDIASGDPRTLAAFKKSMESGEFIASGEIDMKKRGLSSSGALSANMADWTNSFMQTGKDIVDVFNGFKASFSDYIKTIDEANDIAKKTNATELELVGILNAMITNTGDVAGSTRLFESYVISLIRRWTGNVN